MTNEEAIKIIKDYDVYGCGYCHQGGDEIPKAFDLAISALERDRWISVEERLPVGGDKSGAVCEDIWMLFDDGSVFCGWMNGCTETAYYLDGYHDFVRKCPISRVRAWKPKPEPPKEET
jgi:hypothetical protein